jgi:hypothetical protein
MDFSDFCKPIKELRLMGAQPAYRFILVWLLIVMRVVLPYLVLPIGGALALQNFFEFLR